MRHRIKAGALRKVDTWNRHFCDNKPPFSGLDENLDAEAKAFLGDGDSFQQSSAVSSEAALGIGYLLFWAKVVEPGDDIDAEFAIFGHSIEIGRDWWRLVAQIL